MSAGARALPFLASVGASLGACASGDAGSGLSGLLITLDTTNPSALSCYGAPAGLTPNMDRLAREGVLYENARATAPVTAPSHASMLTGLYPLRHSVRMNASMVLPESALTLAECARAKGLETAAVVATVVLKREFGLGQGFERYDEPEGGPSSDPEAVVSRSCIEVTERALAWLDERDSTRPFFLWVHYFDPHGPYRPPDKFTQAAGGDAYLGEVAWVDKQLGRLLERLEQDGLLAETLVVLTADHGEGLGRHGEKTHGTMGFDSTLRVPLVVRYPDGWSAGERFADRVSLVDLYPTFGSALGLDVHADVDGLDLWRRRVPEDRGLYFESYFGTIAYGWSQLAGWIDRDGKYVHTSVPEFYAADDPDEERDLLREGSADVSSKLDAIAALCARRRHEQPGLGGPDADLQAQIEKLGYAGAGTEHFSLPEPLEASDRDSPHAHGEDYALFLRADSLLVRGRPDDALPLLLEVVAGDPRNHTARHLYGQCLMHVGRFTSAIEELERAILLREGLWVAPHLDIALCWEALGRNDEAIESYERALAHGGGPAGAKERWAELLRKEGRAEEAARVEAE